MYFDRLPCLYVAELELENYLKAVTNITCSVRIYSHDPNPEIDIVEIKWGVECENFKFVTTRDYYYGNKLPINDDKLYDVLNEITLSDGKINRKRNH